MLSVADFLAQLPETEYAALANAISTGLHDVRMIATCITEPEPQAENIGELLAYINSAIQRLSVAREIVQLYK